MSEKPPMMPQQVDSLIDLPGRWWVAHTKSRCEKDFAWDLIQPRHRLFSAPDRARADLLEVLG